MDYSISGLYFDFDIFYYPDVIYNRASSIRNEIKSSEKMITPWWRFWAWRQKADFWRRAWAATKEELDDYKSWHEQSQQENESLKIEVKRLNHLLTPKRENPKPRCKKE